MDVLTARPLYAILSSAIAGLLILFINLIGGMLIGTSQHDMDIGAAAETYALRSSLSLAGTAPSSPVWTISHQSGPGARGQQYALTPFVRSVFRE